MRRLIAAAVVIGALLTPVLANAVSVSELQQKIGDLLAQVTQLQEQIKLLNGSTTTDAITTTPVDTVLPSGSACPQIVRQLARGSQGDDVTTLQKFLIAQGVLAGDSVTGFFGPLTESAVREWQAKNNIVSSGDAASNGFGTIGARTRAAILAACGQSADTIPGNDVLSVSVRGLDASVVATVNARGTCDALKYSLDFGDGSAPQTISVPSGTCHPLKQSLSHSFAVGGGYIMTLTSKFGRITVPITASGGPATAAASACVAPTFATTTIPLSSVGTPWAFSVISSADEKNIPAVSATGTPPGISLLNQIQVSTGTASVVRSWTLSGTPIASGTYAITLTANNACGNATRTISLPVNGSNANQCPAAPVPQCSGTLQWNGNDANGCSLGYQCIVSTAKSLQNCPVFMMSQCLNGTYVSQGSDANGCALPPKCVTSTLTEGFAALPASGASPLTVGFYVTNFKDTSSSYSIDFGDGSGTSGSLGWSRSVEGASLYMPHTYSTAGTYTATLMYQAPSTCSAGMTCTQMMPALQTIGTATITASSSQCQLSQTSVDCALGYHYTGTTYTTDSNGCSVPHMGQCVAN